MVAKDIRPIQNILPVLATIHVITILTRRFLLSKVSYVKKLVYDDARPLWNLCTKRQREIIELVAKGQSNKLIARTLGITEGTVKMNLHLMYDKLRISNRTQLAIAYMAERKD